MILKFDIYLNACNVHLCATSWNGKKADLNKCDQSNNVVNEGYNDSHTEKDIKTEAKLKFKTEKKRSLIKIKSL